MFDTSRTNGFFLLLTFGLLCGILAGALFGVGVALYIELHTRGGYDAQALIAFAGIGAGVGLIPGVLFGLLSYYFIDERDWLFTGGVCGAIPGFIYSIPFGWDGWHIAVLCIGYGVLIGMVNARYPNWWGRRLRAEGIELLHRKS